MKFGCKISNYDCRDYTFKHRDVEIPETYILPTLSAVKNQGSVSSCVAHATSSILEYHSKPHRKLSTNFIYGIQKYLFNRDGEGMMLRDACKIAADYGDMLKDDCPGNTEVPKCYKVAEEAFADKNKLDRAHDFRIHKYFLCLGNNDIKYAIFKYGPVLAAIDWYPTYKVGKDGVLVGEKTGKPGGHAFMIYGYTPDGFWCQNSWGYGWGNGGRFFLPNSIKIREARGFIDWDNETELKEPKINSFTNIIYKLFNVLVNLVRKLIYK